MLGRFKNLVIALGLLVLPVYSVRLHSMLGRFKNPVVALELCKRYKNKAYVIVVYAVYAVYAVHSYFVVDAVYKSTLYSRPNFGRLAESAIWSVIVMIFLVVPVLTAVSVVGERRRGTLMLVQLSSLRPCGIVWGKVVASVAPVLFPIAVYMVVLVAFSLGDPRSVGLDNRLRSSVIIGAGLVVLSVAVSVVCVLCSTFAKSSASAIAMSYGLFFWVILPVPFVWELIEPFMLELIESFVWEVLYGRSLGYHPSRFVVALWLGFVGLFACVVGLPFCCLSACRRLRLPVK